MNILVPLTRRFDELYWNQYSLIEFGKLINYESGYFAKCRDEYGIIRFKALKI